jgi:excisionase family DNA binding protein
VPETKKPVRNRPRANESTASGSGSLGEVLSLAEAAAYLRLREADVLRLIEEQSLPARQIGSEWRLLKAAIQRWLAGSASQDYGKAAQLAVAGSWKDDPLVEDELREIYRRRQTPADEGSS